MTKIIKSANASRNTSPTYILYIFIYIYVRFPSLKDKYHCRASDCMCLIALDLASVDFARLEDKCIVDIRDHPSKELLPYRF